MLSISADDVSREAVNVTIGLPSVRTSPDHGTAFDIAGKNKADASSMTAALRLALRQTAAQMARRETELNAASV